MTEQETLKAALEKYRPTHRCFDDACELMDGLVKMEPMFVDLLILVHGVCTAPDGTLYAHAWVELRETCYNGVLDPDGKRHYLEFTKQFFYTAWRVVEAERYTCARALKANKETGTFGPWTEKLKALTAERGTHRKDGA